MEFLFKTDSTSKYNGDFEPFVEEVEECIRLYAQIEKINFEDVSLLLFFYHSIMDLFKDSMKEVMS